MIVDKFFFIDWVLGVSINLLRFPGHQAPTFVHLCMTYRELAIIRLKRMQKTASQIKVTPKAERDKIDLSSSSKQSKRNLDCQP